MKNKDIRRYAEDHGVRLYQIAQRLNINDGNFSRKLRVELSEQMKEKIINIIDEISGENRTGGD